eukprot:gb/GEZJ01004693.1/.p1 GENE.gb/GEZJ01004693.1/~~gb/GEZJ01004693.1/.p1  ORF type:complete len:205 (-),score=26.53 gb/GEZJ01004693.1/:518-1132(-)
MRLKMHHMGVDRGMSCLLRSRGSLGWNLDSDRMGGWGKHGNDTSKKSLSALRREKRHTVSSTTNYGSDLAAPLGGHTDEAGVPIVTTSEFGLNGPQAVSTRCNSMSVPSGGDLDSGGLPGNKEVINFSNTCGLSISGGIAPGENHIVFGKPYILAAKQEVRNPNYANAHANGAMEDGNTLPVVFDEDPGLISLKGDAAWLRSRG